MTLCFDPLPLCHTFWAIGLFPWASVYFLISPIAILLIKLDFSLYTRWKLSDQSDRTRRFLSDQLRFWSDDQYSYKTTEFYRNTHKGAKLRRYPSQTSKIWKKSSNPGQLGASRKPNLCTKKVYVNMGSLANGNCCNFNEKHNFLPHHRLSRKYPDLQDNSSIDSKRVPILNYNLVSDDVIGLLF